MESGIILGLMGLGGQEIFLVALFVLLFFGAKKIPELMRGIGKGMREFKDAMSGIVNEVRNAAKETPAKPVEESKKLETEK